MTLRLSGRESKLEIITLLRKLLMSVIFPHLNMGQREGILEHCAWMERQRDDLNVNCKFETVPELKLTRITLEVSFDNLPPMQVRQ